MMLRYRYSPNVWSTLGSEVLRCGGVGGLPVLVVMEDADTLRLRESGGRSPLRGGSGGGLPAWVTLIFGSLTSSSTAMWVNEWYSESRQGIMRRLWTKWCMSRSPSHSAPCSLSPLVLGLVGLTWVSLETPTFLAFILRSNCKQLKTDLFSVCD